MVNGVCYKYRMTKHLGQSLLVAVGAAALAVGCSREAPAPAPAASTAPAATAPVFDVKLLDTSIAPCQDFNGFVNANWIKANPVPSDRTRWGTFDELAEQSLDHQHELLEKADKGADQATPGSIDQQLGYLYRSGMDEAAIDKAGFDPIKPKLASIAALKTPADVSAWLDRSFADGDEQVFGFGSGADFQNAKMQIGFTGQAGLGLPTADYYTKPDYKDIRDAYVKHVAKYFELTGVAAADAAKKAAAVLAFETALAKHSLLPVELRQPQNVYHFVSVAAADKVTPHFDWAAFFKAQGVEVGKGFSLSPAKFFAQVDTMIATTPVADWRDYLSFHIINDGAPYLSKAFQDEDFDFNGKTLGGQPEQRARWKRVVSIANDAMGEALGQLYVAAYFPPSAKARAEELVTNVRNALKARIQNLDWMSDETKAKALQKWDMFLPKIGYPDKWRTWTGLGVTPGQFYANVMAANTFNYEYRPAQDRHAHGPPRMGHDAADRERVLQPDGQHDQLPGRDPAAAVLLRERRRRRSTTAASAR